MSAKVLVLAGAAAVLGVGAYVGGIAYTKSSGESLATKNFYKVDEAIRDYEIPLKIENKGSESTGFSSSVHTYEITPAKGGFVLPVQVHNNYGFGSVESTVSIEDKVYDGLGLSEKWKMIAKELVSSFKSKYSVFSDEAKAEFNMHDRNIDGDGVFVSWKAGNISFNIKNMSKNPVVSSSVINIPEIAIDAKSEGGLKLAGLSLVSENKSSGNSVAESKVDEISFKSSDVLFSMKKYATKAVLGSATNKKDDQYDIDLDLSVDELKFEEKDKYDVKNAKILLNFKNLNYSEIKKKCESMGVAVDIDSCLSQGLNKLNDKEKSEVLLTALTDETAFTVNLGANLSGANIDLKNNLSFKQGADFKNPFSLITSVQLVSDYSIDSSIFSHPQYKLDSLEGVLKEYAVNPDASTLTYHVEFKDGKLTVNGKSVK
jgi:hypothetical protein